MASGRSSRNNVLAGLFVLASIALGVFIIILVANLWDRLGSKTKYVVAFSVLDGAEGLDQGSAVKVGGKEVGRVVKTDFAFDPKTGEPIGIDVEIEIDSRIRLFEDADVQLQRPLLGSASTINISVLPTYRPPGTGLVGPPRLLAEGGRLRGRLGPPGFLAPADYAKIQEIIERMNLIVTDVQPRVGPLMEDARASVANVRAITDDARVRWEEWGGGVSSIVSRFEAASERAPEVVAAMQEGVERAREFIASVQRMLDENRPKIDEAIEYVRELTRKAQGEAYDKFIAALDTGAQGLESFASTARQADELMAARAPEVGEIITQALLAAQQLKLATVEVRAAPWRLLYQPSKKELENELLYNSVRAYSESVTQLRAAAEALRATAARAAEGTGAARVDPATLEALTQQLKAAFEKYEQTERAFLERWVRE